MISGLTSIVKIKEYHNHPIIIKRNKAISRAQQRSETNDNYKNEQMLDEQYEYIIEEDIISQF